jgi:hypothetical protein
MIAGGWYVLVEESIQLWNEIGWGLSRYYPADDMEHAVGLAVQVAQTHQPRLPRWPQSRSLFRGPDGSWLVAVKGVTRHHTFRVTIAEYYGTFPGGTSA